MFSPSEAQYQIYILSHKAGIHSGDNHLGRFLAFTHLCQIGDIDKIDGSILENRLGVCLCTNVPGYHRDQSICFGIVKIHGFGSCHIDVDFLPVVGGRCSHAFPNQADLCPKLPKVGWRVSVPKGWLLQIPEWFSSL